MMRKADVVSGQQFGLTSQKRIINRLGQINMYLIYMLLIDTSQDSYEYASWGKSLSFDENRLRQRIPRVEYKFPTEIRAQPQIWTLGRFSVPILAAWLRVECQCHLIWDRSAVFPRKRRDAARI
jgi:hypothetical protein